MFVDLCVCVVVNLCVCVCLRVCVCECVFVCHCRSVCVFVDHCVSVHGDVDLCVWRSTYADLCVCFLCGCRRGVTRLRGCAACVHACVCVHQHHDMWLQDFTRSIFTVG